MTAYYNEIDRHAAQWLRNLIAAGHIAPGHVDERDIRDVKPSDLKGYTQCHFFAGIGVWSRSARQAGWPDDEQLWTASCPCQPFSAAGERGGFADERHLWPAFYHLVSECGPSVVAGEQVASKDGLAWLDLVQADMEAADYAFAPFDLCAAGFGAPHIRQRLFFVGLADSLHSRFEGRLSGRSDSERENLDGHLGCSSPAGGMVDSSRPIGSGGRILGPSEGNCAFPQQGSEQRSERGSALSGLAHDNVERRGELAEHSVSNPQPGSDVDTSSGSSGRRPGPTNGFWAAADWLRCQDAKWRPVEPSTFPLAHGSTARVGRLRAYGNAIVEEVAKGFLESIRETIHV